MVLPYRGSISDQFGKRLKKNSRCERHFHHHEAENLNAFTQSAGCCRAKKSCGVWSAHDWRSIWRQRHPLESTLLAAKESPDTKQRSLPRHLTWSLFWQWKRCKYSVGNHSWTADIHVGCSAVVAYAVYATLPLSKEWSGQVPGQGSLFSI